MRFSFIGFIATLILTSCENKNAENSLASTVKVEISADTTIFYGSAIIVNWSYIQSEKGSDDLTALRSSLQQTLVQIEGFLKDSKVAYKIVETPVVKVKNEKGVEYSRTFVSQVPYKCLVVHSSGAVLPIGDIQNFNEIKDALSKGGNYQNSIDESTQEGREEAKREMERSLGNPVSDPNEKPQELPQNQILQKGEPVTNQKK